MVVGLSLFFFYPPPLPLLFRHGKLSSGYIPIEKILPQIQVADH